jgi:hypothetical protein
MLIFMGYNFVVYVFITTKIFLTFKRLPFKKKRKSWNNTGEEHGKSQIQPLVCLNHKRDPEHKNYIYFLSGVHDWTRILLMVGKCSNTEPYPQLFT